MLKKYRLEVGRLIIASHIFILPPILELHNKNSFSRYITCQLTSPTVYSCGSSLIHAEVFQVPYSCVQCCRAKLCEIEVNPALLLQFCQPIITVNARFSGSTVFHELESNHSRCPFWHGNL